MFAPRTTDQYGSQRITDYYTASATPRSPYTRYFDAGSPGSDSDYGLTPTPRTRTSSAGASYRKSPLSEYQRHSDGMGTPAVRRDLSLELSRSSERYSSRGSLAQMHPSYTATTAAVPRPVTPIEPRTWIPIPQRGTRLETTANFSAPDSSLSRQGNGLRDAVYEPSSPKRRPPSMVKDPHATFLPRREYHDRSKPVVVLDLDETLVYARDGPIHIRDGTKHLLSTLAGNAEVVVWTAGEREYAQTVIARLDPDETIHHCVYRHPKWWSGKPGYSKNLQMLGRPIDRVVLVDNTPDCLKDHPWNGILVEDFTGAHDDTMYELARVMQRIFEAPENERIPDILSRCPELVRRRVPLDSYGTIEVWTLRSANGDFSPSRVNRDLQRVASAYRPNRW